MSAIEEALNTNIPTKEMREKARKEYVRMKETIESFEMQHRAWGATMDMWAMYQRQIREVLHKYGFPDNPNDGERIRKQMEIINSKQPISDLSR